MYTRKKPEAMKISSEHIKHTYAYGGLLPSLPLGRFMCHEGIEGQRGIEFLYTYAMHG
jgi:hypothetical protein